MSFSSHRQGPPAAETPAPARSTAAPEPSQRAAAQRLQPSSFWQKLTDFWQDAGEDLTRWISRLFACGCAGFRMIGLRVRASWKGKRSASPGRCVLLHYLTGAVNEISLYSE